MIEQMFARASTGQRRPRDCPLLQTDREYLSRHRTTAIAHELTDHSVGLSVDDRQHLCGMPLFIVSTSDSNHPDSRRAAGATLNGLRMFGAGFGVLVAGALIRLTGGFEPLADSAVSVRVAFAHALMVMGWTFAGLTAAMTALAIRGSARPARVPHRTGSILTRSLVG